MTILRKTSFRDTNVSQRTKLEKIMVNDKLTKGILNFIDLLVRDHFALNAN